MDESIDLTSSDHSALRITPHEMWDTIVIGGGPAGAMAARQCALLGLKTLLIEAKVFPREKVCGGVLSQRAMQLLQHTGLDELAVRQGAPVSEIDVICGRQRSRFPLPVCRVVCRSWFDAALVAPAADAGARVVYGVQAVVEPASERRFRQVSILHNSQRLQLRGRAVVCADGLARSSVRHLPELAGTTVSNSLMGLGAVVADDSGAFAIGRITMVVSPRGYVGIARVSASQLNIAAAVSPRVLTQAAPATAIAGMLGDAGVSRPTGLDDATWRGTPPLTSRPRRVATERTFVIGDAGGYIEPFTGEGMAAALETGLAVASFVQQAVEGWAPSLATCWNALHRQIVVDRQSTCRRLAWIVRRPWATFVTLAACRTWPGIARHVIAETVRPSITCTALGNTTP